MSYEAFIVKMHNLILSEAPISTIVGVAAEELGNPVLTTDCDLRCIAKSEESIDNPVWELMSEWSPTEKKPLWEELNQERMTERAQGSIKPFINSFDFSEHRIMDMVIRWRGTILGIIHVFEYNKPFSEEDSGIVKELARSLAFVLTTQQTTGSRSLSSEEIALRYLLNGASVAQELLKDRLFTLEPPNRYALIVAENIDEQNPSHFLSSARNTLSNSIPLSRGLLYEDQVVILAQIPVRGGFFNWSWERFREILQSQQLRAAVSDPFTNYHNIQNFYSQSLKALQIGKRFVPNEPLFMYEDVGLYELLDAVGERFIGSNAKYPPLQALLEHDEKHGTTYFRDLFVYLQNDCSARRTAEVLSVHKNTVNYRISRIASVMGRDLTDNAFMFRLNLSVKILYYQQASNFSEKYNIPESLIKWPVI